MGGMRRLGARLGAPLGALILALVPGAAAALDAPHPLAVWIAPGGDHARPPAAGLLHHPPGWTSGDAAVVLAPGGDWPDGARDALIDALLGAGAAVLVIPDAAPGPVAPRLSDALRALRRDLGAGIVVAIGRGAAGEATLGLRTAALPGEALPFAALVSLGPGAPGFAPGEAAPAEDWPRRAPLLCDLLAAAALPDVPELPAACRAALPGPR
jgi:hypothetical protein